MTRSSILARAALAAAAVSGGALMSFSASAGAATRHAVTGAGYVQDPTTLVNPFIGTTNGGDTFPGADMPFGMIQWSPNTPSRPAGGNYSYSDNSILGYALTNMSGPGCSAEGDVPILPTAGAIPSDPASAATPLDHSTEKASPGYYEETSGGIRTQLATTLRAGIGQFTFPAGQSSGNLLFKLSDSATSDTATSWQVISPTEVSGSVTTGGFCGGGNVYTLHFDMRFNRPMSSYGTWKNGSSAVAGTRTESSRLSPAERARALGQEKVAAQSALADKGLPGPANSRNGRLRAQGTLSTPSSTRTASAGASPVSGADGAYVTFNTSGTGNNTVIAKVGISYVSNAGAAQNLAREIPGFDLSTVQSAAHDAWDAALSKIQIAGGTHAQQATFYTALYHSLLHPNIDSDVNGQYMGFDGQVHTTPTGHPIYANYSGWDIYRSQSQLESMLFPRQMSDTVRSMLADYNQTGMFPKWNANNGETYVMVGDPSDPIIADAHAFGARGYNAHQALADMQTEAQTTNNIRPGNSYYQNNGYLPIDGSYGCCNFYGAVSTQEEYNAADNSISLLASALGDQSVAQTFAARANNWQNVFNPATGFLQPKLMDGSFQSGFAPTGSNGFVEADAYVYRAELPFDIAGVAAAEGGDSAWRSVLDGLTQSVTGMSATEAQLGNEPSFDIPWEYDYVGAPYKTEQVVREVQNQLYTDTPGGLAGNDDLGAMSSWLVWSGLGAYPETPGSAVTALGSPEFNQIAIHLGNGNTITESAPQAAKDAPYVQSMTVNGQAWNNAYLPAGLFSQGGTVDWTLGTTPNTSFASNATTEAPPSNTAGLDPALGSVAGPDGASQEVVQPGSSVTLTLGAQSLSASGQTVNWTATTTSGSGITTGPSSGSIIVGPEQMATRQVKVSVPSSTADGKYQVVFHLTTANGTALPNVVEDIGVAAAGDLSPYFNNAGVCSDGSASAADFDGDGFCYSQQQLAAQGVTLGGTVKANDGVTYQFPAAAAGQPDNVITGGQTITVLPVSGATQIGFLGSASNGPSTGTATIHYTDGSSQQVTLDFGDWTLNAGASQPPAGNVVVADTPYRDSSNGGTQTVGTYLFSAAFPVTSGKTVQSVTLPASTDQGELHVFAIGSDKGPLTN
ncbi:MAG TPA: lectin [Solirubrobacteraceae bacterium]|nr:lectin [Solirubrobacteraceae bacterium]